MIIKRWNGTAFVKEFPETKAQLIRNNGDSANIFDANDKLLPAYLPDSVFDNLLFYGTTTGDVASTASRLILANALEDARVAADLADRSIKGYYFVITATGTITGLTGVAAYPAGVNVFYTLQFRPQDGGTSGTANTSSGILEPGDWFVIETITGAGTSGSPYVIVASVINNSFELMTGAGASTAGAPGVVPGPASGQNLHFLRGDGTWVIPTNTTYTGSTSITLNGTSFERAALTGDVTASGNSNATTIANDAVTFAKMQNIAADTILGRVTAGSGDPEALTAAQVRTLLNVANGATANSGTVTSVSGTGTTAGLSLSGTVTTSGNLTLGGTLSTPVSTINDSTTVGQNLVKLTNPGAIRFIRINADNTVSSLTDSDFRTAIGATGNLGTVTSVGGTGTVAGLSLSGTVTSSGNLTLGGALSTPVSTINDSTTVGQNLVKLTNPGAIRFLRINANNTVDALSDSAFRTAIGAGTSSTTGTVTSVATSGTVNGLTLTGGTITTAGTITLGGTLSGVANSALSSMAASTIKGRITASTGAPEDLTASNVRSIIELAAPIYVQTATPTTSVTHALWYDIN